MSSVGTTDVCGQLTLGLSRQYEKEVDTEGVHVSRNTGGDGNLGDVGIATFPVFNKAKSSAKLSGCYQNLRTQHMMIALYRENYGSSDAPGYTWQMGLPDNGYHDVIAELGESFRPWFESGKWCNGGQRYPEGAAGNPGFARMWPFASVVVGIDPAPYQEDWLEYVTAVENNALLYADPNHPDKWPASRLSLHHAFGITLTGTLLKKTKRGRPGSLTYWMD